MVDTPIACTFPAAYHRGGVERIVWETLRHFAPRRETVFVGYEFECTALPGVAHLEVVRPRWARGALAPVGFRRAARHALNRSERNFTEVSFGANAPPGDVYVVNSVHRAWLQKGKEIR